jgi:ferredoxin
VATVLFEAMGRSWRADVPVGTTLLEAARRCGAPEGDACGGVGACASCHVYVQEGRERLSAAREREEDTLDKAFDVRLSSRLGCQATVAREGQVRVEICRESLDAFYAEHAERADPRRQQKG